MSWESTATYYRLINEGVRERLGGLHSAELVLYSVDFEPVEQLQVRGDWDEAGRVLARAAQGVEAAGGEVLVLCTNTMHKVAEAIEAAVDIPFLHIADATAAALKLAGHRRVGLLGTAFTMEQEFYRGRLQDQHGLEVLIPGDDDRRIVHDVIYDELCLGRVVEPSRREYGRIIDALQREGAEAVVLGCTEISLLVGEGDSPIPLFDTTAIHAAAAVDAALEA